MVTHPVVALPRGGRHDKASQSLALLVLLYLESRCHFRRAPAFPLSEENVRPRVDLDGRPLLQRTESLVFRPGSGYGTSHRQI